MACKSFGPEVSSDIVRSKIFQAKKLFREVIELISNIRSYVDTIENTIDLSDISPDQILAYEEKIAKRNFTLNGPDFTIYIFLIVRMLLHEARTIENDFKSAIENAHPSHLPKPTDVIPEIAEAHRVMELNFKQTVNRITENEKRTRKMLMMNR